MRKFDTSISAYYTVILVAIHDTFKPEMTKPKTQDNLSTHFQHTGHLKTPIFFHYARRKWVLVRANTATAMKIARDKSPVRTPKL